MCGLVFLCTLISPGPPKRRFDSTQMKALAPEQCQKWSLVFSFRGKTKLQTQNPKHYSLKGL
jgi:hypothetical protein